MQYTLKTLAAGLLTAAALLPGLAYSESDGWTTLVDSSNKGDLDRGRQGQLGDEGRRAHR
jgi:hypothetical protein